MHRNSTAHRALAFLAALPEGATASLRDLVTAVDAEYNTVSVTLMNLKARDHVVAKYRGQYVITPKGADALAAMTATPAASAVLTSGSVAEGILLELDARAGKGVYVNKLALALPAHDYETIRLTCTNLARMKYLETPSHNVYRITHAGVAALNEHLSHEATTPAVTESLSDSGFSGFGRSGTDRDKTDAEILADQAALRALPTRQTTQQET
jgi:predicted transcriptional regulator